jgi:hypothetical protein
MSTKFFTNDGGNTLLKKFEGVFERNKDIRFLDTLKGILNRDLLDDIGEDVRSALSIRSYANLKPDIIISESFAG